jgi:hypothetical protein
LLGCGSLPEREWDHANGYKQNQVTGTSNKVRSNQGVNTVFHFDRAPAKQTAFTGSALKRQDFLADGNRGATEQCQWKQKRRSFLGVI